MKKDNHIEKPVLVIGGAGYIGSHMVQLLVDKGYFVTVLDNLSRGHRDAVGCAELIQGDLCNPDDLARLFAGRSFAAVLHFAALAYVGESVTEPRTYYENNVVGTLNLLNAMLDVGIDKFVFSSSCATYGTPVEIPMDEDHPQQPINPYGRTKLMVENILADYAVAYGLQSVALRYFNAAGSDSAGRLGERHNPETHLIPLILQEALRVKYGGNPEETTLQIFGDDFVTADGTCVRDYIHVDDLCAAHLAALDRLLADRCQGSEAYNLGTGVGHTVREVIAACRRVSGCEIRYRVAGRRPGDPAELVASSLLASQILDWNPCYRDLDGIVASAWAWMQRRTE